MIKKNYVISIVILVVLFLMLSQLLMSCMSDDKVEQLAQAFIEKCNAGNSFNSQVSRKLWEGTKRVMYTENGKLQILVDVDCKNKEVVNYINENLKYEAIKENNLYIASKKSSNSRTLLTEAKAKEIALLYAQKIKLPQDVAFSHMRLEQSNVGVWNAHWRRTLNGYEYENDSVILGVMAVDGKLYSYKKFIRGKPCPTEIKISKDRAIEIGKKKLLDLLEHGPGKNYYSSYVVNSAEVKIIQPNAIFGFMTPYHRANSRLAWLITFSLHNYDLKVAESVNFADRFVVKIDTYNGNVIGGSFGK